MSKQSTIKINKSFDDKFLLLGQTVEGRVKDQLFSMADFAISRSPVDTGAYVESFSMIPAGQGGGRMKSRSARVKKEFVESVKKGTANREEFASEARENLYGDINKFNLETSDKITLINRSTHARDVEDAYGYGVFAKVRNKFG